MLFRKNAVGRGSAGRWPSVFGRLPNTFISPFHMRRRAVKEFVISSLRRAGENGPRAAGAPGLIASMRRSFGWALGVSSILFASIALAAPPGGAASWPKTFSDEFSGTAIDTTKWSYGSLPWGGQHHTADYSSWITPEDSYLTNGMLVLRCRQAVGSEFGGYPFSEGFVHSHGHLDYTYGYVEIRARFPLGAGTWPAFWSLSWTAGWPPEFDIAELFGGGDDRMHMGLAYSSGGTQWDSSNFYQSSEAFQNWHTYGLEWGPGYAIWYKDGALKKAIYASYVPSVSMYVMLNSGMRYSTNATTPIPNYFDVDCFRKYDPPAAVINDATTGTGINQCNFVGTWGFNSPQSGSFFNDLHYSTTANAYVEVQFNGTRVDFYGRKSPTQGIGAFSIDDGPETLVDFYSTSYLDRQLIWSATSLPAGPHTLKMRVTGTKNASSSGTTVSCDRVDVWGNVSPLMGTLVGTAGTYGGGNTKEKAVDGNLTTFFDGPDASGNWVGYDLGATPRQITRVLYCPRSGYPSRMVNGKFQGANLSDFSDAVDLFSVTEAPVEGTMTEQTIANTSGFRYVRYFGPTNGNCNVAELEFYGTEVGAGNGTWTSDSDGTWSTSNRWSGNIIATGAGFTADFSTINITGNRTVTLDTSRAIGTLKFGDTSGGQSWMLGSSGGSSLTLDTGSLTVPSIVVNQNTATIFAPLAGANGFTKSGAGTLILDGSNALAGTVNIDTSSTTSNQGAVRAAHPGALANVTTIQIRNNNDGNSTLQLDGASGGLGVPARLNVNCRNNSVATIQNLAGTNILSGFIALNVGGDMFNIQSDAGLLVFSGTNQYVGSLTGGRSYAFSGAGHHLVAAPILNSTNGAPISLTKSGTGRLTLAAGNTYGSTTTVGAGTLVVNGAIGPGAVTIAGGTLGGTGTISGPVTVQSGSRLSPGTSIGALTINNNLTLNAGSATLMELNKTSGTHDQVICSGALAYNGSLTVTNLSGALAAGDSFKLFTFAGSNGAFTSTNLPSLDDGLACNFNPGDGVLRVISTVPTNIVVVYLGNTLELSWPAGHTGWRLQVQTNSLAAGLGTNWFDVSGAASTNRILVQIDSGNDSVFYRLVYP